MTTLIFKEYVEHDWRLTGRNDKETNKMASKWSEFHSIYKSQLEDMLIDKFKISDPDIELKETPINTESINTQENLKKIKS